jgi:hemolysin activation/secretion protein
MSQEEAENALSDTARYLRTAALCLLFCAFSAQTVDAQPATSSNTDLNRRAKQEALERQQRIQAPDVFLQQEKGGDNENYDLPYEEAAFFIKTIQIEGGQAERFRWIQETADHFAGQRIGKEGINRITKRITNALIGRGYITTRLMIPEQNLATGALKFVLVPGIIRDIRFATPPERGSWSSAFPVRPGAILNLRDLEQGLEQMKRVPSQDVDMKLVPGEKPGESDVVISIQQKKNWNFIFSADDSGGKATGRNQFSQTFSMDNLFGANDLFNISTNRDFERKGKQYGTDGGSFYYSVPSGYWTYTLAKSHYDYHQTITGEYTDYVSSGNSNTTEFRAERLIGRDQTSKTTLKLKVIKKHIRSYLDDTEIEVQRRDTNAAEVGIAHRRYYGKAVWDVELAHRWGTPWFGAQDEAGKLPSDTPTTRYHLWIFDSSYNIPIKIGEQDGRYTLTIRAQTTGDVLYATDYFSIGNRYTVRGFDGEQTLAAEKGWFIQNEVSLPLMQGHEIYAGIDYGAVSGPSSAWLAGKHLTGSVLGLRGSIKDAYYDVFVGWPLNKPGGYKTAHTTYGFQLAYRI